MQYSFSSSFSIWWCCLIKGRKKKTTRESGDSFVNVYLRLQLTCFLLPAICCCRLCLFRVFLDIFPFCFLQCTALPAFCNCHLFFFNLQFVWGVTLPTLRWSFPQHSLCYKLSPLQGCWVGAAAPDFSGRPVNLQFRWGCAPPSLSRARGALPSFLHVFFFSAACLLFSWLFSLFSPGWGSACPGAMLIWPRVVCGSTMYCLAHLVVCFSQAG
jgi:hypothetical protein